VGIGLSQVAAQVIVAVNPAKPTTGLEMTPTADHALRIVRDGEVCWLEAVSAPR